MAQLSFEFEFSISSWFSECITVSFFFKILSHLALVWALCFGSLFWNLGTHAHEGLDVTWCYHIQDFFKGTTPTACCTAGCAMFRTMEIGVKQSLRRNHLSQGRSTPCIGDGENPTFNRESL